ncbi:MAG: response regulator [Verrucomicrobiales bacterium]|nr:response regulator [Verrucomicrobiales bacterium]
MKKRILIIEDDQIVATVYRNLLNNRGYQAEVAVDGPSGLAAVQSFKPDAILLDIMLPHTSGVELLQRIRSDSSLAGVPVLVFTNAYIPNMVEVARNSGANFVFSKSTLTSRQLLEALAASVPGAPAPLATAFVRRGDSAASATTGSLSSPTLSTPVAANTAPRNEGNIVPMGNPSWEGFSSPLPAPEAGSSAATEIIYRDRSRSNRPSTPSTAQIHKQSEAPAPDIARLKQDFLQTVDKSITQLRYNLSELAKAANEASQSGMLEELHRQVRGIGANAGFAGFQPAADLSAAFEVLLRELSEKPKNYNASIQRTTADTVDVLTELLVHRIEDNLLEDPPPAILVVDDEMLSRRAVTFALEKGHLRATDTADPQEALKLATSQPYDLIFLDVQMPGLNGFDLCTQIRAQLVNQKTPVIFVTSMTDFKSRVRSTLSGGTDLIAKPFMFFELTVKAMSTLLRNRAAVLSSKKLKQAA